MDFTLQTVLEKQDPNTLTDKDHLFADDVRIYPFTIDMQEDGIFLLSDDHTFWRPIKVGLDDNSLKHFRHDFVANLCEGGTDVKLSEIDPHYDPHASRAEHRLSPDFYDPEKRTILELGTTKSVELSSLMATYRAKDTKYRSYIADMEINELYVLIVGSEGLVTNMVLSQPTVNALVSRYRTALSLEAAMTIKLGRNPFLADEVQVTYEKMENILNSIKPPTPLAASEEFDDIVWQAAQKELSEEEKTLVNMKVAVSVQYALEFEKKPLSILDDYVKKMTDRETTTKHKRVSVFPFILPCRNTTERNFTILPDFQNYNATCPSYIYQLWKQALPTHLEKFTVKTEEESIAECFKENLPKHVWKSMQKARVELSSEDRIEAAKAGLWAKELDNSRQPETLREKILEGHKGFSLDSSTADIEEFIKGPLLTNYIGGYSHHGTYMDLIDKAKADAQGERSKTNLTPSNSIWKLLIAPSELVNFADFISCVVQEIALAAKHFIKKDEVLIKQLKYYDCILMIIPTGTHIHVSTLTYYRSTKIVDPGHIGASVYRVGEYYLSDFFSLNEVSLEHFCKAGPYIGALLVDMIAHFNINPMDISKKTFFTHDTLPELWQTIKGIFLVYMNNKLDLEELITSQRYLFMGLMDEVNPDPMKFVERLPEVLRSRLTVYFTNRTIELMRYYYNNPIEKHMFQNPSGDASISYLNIRSLFCDQTVSMEQKIVEFYFGYVVSKEKGRGSMKSFSITQKLYKEELKYYKRTGSVLRVLDDPEPHCTDVDVLIRFCDFTDGLLSQMYGDNFKETIKDEILREYSGTNFSDLATLKASAKNHLEHLDMAEDKVNETRDVKDLLKYLRETNPTEFAKRPKMLEAITKLTQEWAKKKGRYPDHVFEMVPYCINALEDKGGFESDLFPKSQHGGDREIHVLEVKARLIQYFLETISRTYCKKFKSETITHPDTKETIVPTHYKRSALSFEEFVTVCKSADATKWCQNHHASKFAVMLIRLTHPIFHNFIYRTLRLWTCKLINLPMDLVSVFLKNRDTQTGNKSFDAMRSAFYSGSKPFLEPQGHKIRIRSGMFQGILHYTSSFCHTMIQEYNRSATTQMIRQSIGIQPIVSVCQSSDDTGMLISVPLVKPRAELIYYLYGMMGWKEQISPLISILPSVAKSTLMAINLFEYNSEWFLRQKVVRPRFRWISACLESTMTENIVTRGRIFSNILTQAVEGGASCLEASLIQIAQAWMHYKILGLDVNPVFPAFKRHLMDYPDPSLGFFHLEPDLTAGITGYDFSLFLSLKANQRMLLEIPTQLVAEDVMHNWQDWDNPDKKDHLSSHQLSFSDYTIWKRIAENLNLLSMKELREHAERNPEILYGKKHSWAENRVALSMKLHSPGVKQSLSGHQPLIRMIVSSAYILNRKCIRTRGIEEKRSLYEIICSYKNKSVVTPKAGHEERLNELFPFKNEYELLLDYIMDLQATAVARDELLARRSKYRVSVFSVGEDDFSLVQVCRRKWFGHDWLVPVGRTHFEVLWRQTVEKYRFLRDDAKSTAAGLKMDQIELRFFLEDMHNKPRSVKLTDTAAKGKNLASIITRVYWPLKKIRSAAEPRGMSAFANLKSNIYSVISYCFTQARGTKLLRDLLSSASVLKPEYTQLPKEMRSLKIIHDYFNGTDKISLLSRLKNLRTGRIGFFSVRQEYSQSTRQLGGYGCWVGVVSGVSCKIEMMDSNITRITVNSMMETDALAWNLSSLIRDFRMKPSTKKPTTPTNLYLTEHSRFKYSKSTIIGAHPVYIDPEMKFDVLDEIANSMWSLAFTPGSVKLVFTKDKTNHSYTILSELVNVKDWDPSSPYLVNDSLMHSCYYKNEPLPLDECRKLLLSLVPINNQTRTRRLRVYNDARVYGGFDVRKLSQLFLRNCFPGHVDSKEMAEFIAKTNQMLHTEHPISLEEITSMMSEFERIPFSMKDLNAVKDAMGMMRDDDSEEREEELSEKLGLSDQGDIRSILRLDEVKEEDVKKMQNFLSETKESEVSWAEAMEIREALSIGMPRGNDFLYHLKEICRTELVDHKISDILNAETFYYQGLVGQILTIITCKDMLLVLELDVFDDYDPSEKETNLSDYSIKTSRTAERLKNQIEELDVMISNATAENRQILLATRALRLKSLSEMEEDELLNVRSFVLQDIPKIKFMNDLAKELVNRNKLDEEIVYTADIMPPYRHVEMACIKHMGRMRRELEMSENDLSAYYGAMRAGIFTYELIDLLCETFRLNICFIANDEEVLSVDAAPVEGEHTSLITYYYDFGIFG